MPATVAGALISQLLADPVLCAGQTINNVFVPGLVPNGPYLGLIPEQNVTPPAISVESKIVKTDWITTTSRFEDHRTTIICYATQGATPAVDNAAEALMTQTEAVIDWGDLGMAGTITIGIKRETRETTEEKKKAADGSPVFKCRAEWLLRLWTGP